MQGTGALGIILMGVMTIAGCFLCFCLAELATMWPDRTGGIPSFATESFRPWTGDTAARHIGGVSGWAYWLGWFPVAPINVILTASYLAFLFKFSQGHMVDPVGTTWGTPIGITIVLVCFALLILIFIPAYLGIRLGAAFATVLGILSMLPITVMIFLPFFHPSSLHWGNVAGFHAPPDVVVTFTFICAWFFPILWNVIAMEAAACYVGECRGGARDAKIALTAEGLFGVFIYVATPLMFVAVLGVALSAAQAAPLTAYLSYTAKIFGGGSWETWFVGIPLIAALALSVLNAIMGVGRSLYQAAEDGQLPRWFQHRNRHGVPDYAMAFNVVCSMVLVLLGSPLRIYIISNGGYLLSCSLAFLGYFVYRQLRPDTPRPFRLPTLRSGSRSRCSSSGRSSTSTAAGTRRRSSWPTPTRGPGSTCSACSSSRCTRRCTGGGSGRTTGSRPRAGFRRPCPPPRVPTWGPWRRRPTGTARPGWPPATAAWPTRSAVPRHHRAIRRPPGSGRS